MYIWRKRATTGWLRLRSEDLVRRFGATLAVIERPGNARTLLETACSTNTQARNLIREFGGSVEKLRPDWLEHFAKRTEAKPLRIGSRLIVRRAPASQREQPHSHARNLIIPADAAFGTGEHATTTMCLRLLERVTRKRSGAWAMLDAGTGSGILAIAGSCFGATRVVAIDNDPLASAIATRNARANGRRNIEFLTGDVLKQRFAKKFDIITANLFSEILIATLPLWSRHLGRDGCLILSGILRSQEKAMLRALKPLGFGILETRRRGKWIAVLASQRTAQRAVST
jgi:ribosomal protein L11 methyltransferase